MSKTKSGLNASMFTQEFIDWTETVQQSVSKRRIREDIETLSDVRNRLVDPGEMHHKEEYIEKGFEAAGWKSTRHSFTFHDVEGIADHSGEDGRVERIKYDKLDGVNIVAWKQGAMGNSTILIGAHYDTVRDSPGADDNGSGVGALLEIARVLAPYEFEQNIMLVAFDMEEIGFFGSRAIAEGFVKQVNIISAIILESVGYTSRQPQSQKIPAKIGLVYRKQFRSIKRRDFIGDWFLLVYRRSSLEIASVVNRALQSVCGSERAIMFRDPIDLPILGNILSYLVPWVKDFARSDHKSFWDLNISAVEITDTANFRNPNYHKDTDTADTLDYQFIRDVVCATSISLGIIAKLKVRDNAGQKIS
jgi:hypothetical protein